MENTEDLDISIEDIGTILKSNRLKQKKNLEDISSELCIRKIYLVALEEGDYETLPPVPYGVGYVRTYARYLGLNPERAVKLYKDASVAEDEIDEDKKETSDKNKSSSWHIVAGILALGAVYGGWSWYTMSTTPKTVNIPEQEVVNTVEIREDSQETPLTENVIEEVRPEENSGEETQVMLTQEVAIIEQSEPQPAEVIVQPVENDKVVLEFKGETWVELKDKNKVYFQGVFHEGDKKEIKYTDNLFLSVGRPYNVKVLVKGVEKDILIKRRKMNIPLDSLN